jgi:hypothetical protein
VGSVGAGLANGRGKSNTGSAQGKTGGRTRCRAKHKALAVVLDLGLCQRIEIGNDLGPGACAIKRGDAVLQRFLEHEREEAAEHMTADGLVELVEDRPRCEEMLGRAEGLFHGPQLLVAEHCFERVELAAQLGIATTTDPKTGIAPKELAATVMRIFNLPEIASLRPRLIAEHTVYGRQADGTSEILISGIADAVASDGREQIDVIVDWKSDVEMTADKLATYRGQLDAYARNTGAKTALLVLVTTGMVLRA